MGVPIKLHEHEFVDGKCRCGLERPKPDTYAAQVEALEDVLRASRDLEHSHTHSHFCWLTPQHWPHSQDRCTNCNLSGATGMFVMYDGVEDRVVRGCDNCAKLRREELGAMELAPEAWMEWYRAYWGATMNDVKISQSSKIFNSVCFQKFAAGAI